MQLVTVVILALVAFSEQVTITRSTDNVEASEPAHILPKIVGGGEATLHQFPHQVALLIDGVKHCSGSIIASRTIITAAHCLSPTAKDVVVIAGAHNIKADGSADTESRRQVLVSKEFRFPTEWDPTNPQLNDIALIILPADLIREPGVIDSINFHQAACPDTTLEETEATISGWGISDSSSSISSDILHFAKGKINTNNNCNSQYGNIGNSHICLAGENVGECNGDDGGPLSYYDATNNEILAGIASFRSAWGCGVGFDSVYTRVSCHKTWIDANIEPRPTKQ